MSTPSTRRAARRSLGGLAALSLIACSCGSSGSDQPAGEDGDGGDAVTANTEPADPAPAAATTALADVNILTDFADVCRGTTLPGATPYDGTRTGVHPVMYAIGEHPAYEDVIASMPTQWDPVSGQEATAELVACIARTASSLVQTCEGYEDDDVPTGNTVELYDATYEVRLLQATSGEELAATTIAATSGDCPMIFFFDADETVGIDYADPGDQLTAWMAPYVET